MPNSDHRKKTMLKNEQLRMRNRAGRSRVSTQIKKVLAALEEKNSERAQAEFHTAIKLIDRAVTKGLYHKNTAARKKSGLARQLAQASA